MKKLAGLVLIPIFLLYLAIYVSFINVPVIPVYEDKGPPAQTGGFRQYEDPLYSFIMRNFVDEDGAIVTNLRHYEGSGDTLSESVGLFMQYCVLADRKDQFDREVDYLKKNMLTNRNLIPWKYGKSAAGCNAAIDDLRIIRALEEAFERWGNRDYHDLSGFLQEGLFNLQVNGRNLYEFYDWGAEKSPHRIPLSYLDLYTLDGLSEFNKSWLNVEEKGLSVINGGRINESSPFYFKYYDYDSGGYAFDEEYRKDRGICLTYTLITAIHLAEVNETTDELTRWLKAEMGKGRLYAWYNPHTLKPVNTIESTAVYALAAAYADRRGEKELYSQLIGAMLKFNVQEKRSRYFGGFGDPAAGDFYSFDNLTALWALALSGR